MVDLLQKTLIKKNFIYKFYVKDKIYKRIKNSGLFHNDYRTKGPSYIFVKNNKIYLIDYDGLSANKHKYMKNRNNIQKIINQLTI